MQTPKLPRLTRRAERLVEVLIPSDAAEYLEERPNAPARQPIVIEGHSIELGGEKAFQEPLDRRSLRR